MIPPHPYHQLGQFPFGTDWNDFQNAYASTTFPNYSFTGSPNTSGSGGSDESMNQSTREDRKKDPRYLEKRAKNNVAAQKSRKVRREKETRLQMENDELKQRLTFYEKQNQGLLKQLDELTKVLNAKSAENAELKKRLEALQPHPFRDISNIPRYETLN